MDTAVIRQLDMCSESCYAADKTISQSCFQAADRALICCSTAQQQCGVRACVRASGNS